MERMSFLDWCLKNDQQQPLQQWDYVENNFGPGEVSFCSRKECCWICEKVPEHKWSEPPERRIHHKSQKCPFCSGRFLTKSVNSLAAKYPRIAEEFDQEQNGIAPDQIFPKSNRKYWWRCTRGHHWQTTPNTRTGQRGGCPYCDRRLASPDYNLETEFPIVAEEWLYEKNDGLPTEYLPRSEKKVWWRCRYHPDIEWQSAICNRTSSRISNCPICQKERGTSFPEQALYYYLKLLFGDAENRSEIQGVETDIYLPSLKVAIEYDGYYYHDQLSGQEKEEKKDRQLKAAGLSVLHIKEISADDTASSSDSILWCPVKNYKNYLFLETITRKLVSWLNERYGLHLVIRPDIH